MCYESITLVFWSRDLSVRFVSARDSSLYKHVHDKALVHSGAETSTKSSTCHGNS